MAGAGKEQPVLIWQHRLSLSACVSSDRFVMEPRAVGREKRGLQGLGRTEAAVSLRSQRRPEPSGRPWKNWAPWTPTTKTGKLLGKKSRLLKIRNTEKFVLPALPSTPFPELMSNVGFC